MEPEAFRRFVSRTGAYYTRTDEHSNDYFYYHVTKFFDLVLKIPLDVEADMPQVLEEKVKAAIDAVKAVC